MLIRNDGERWKQVQKNVSPQGGASPGILTVTPKGHCPESPAGSRWAPAGDACHVSFRSEATGTVLCSEGGSRGRCAGLQAPRMCVRECLHPESTAPASWGAEASPGWKCRWPCGSECVLWGLVVPSGALLCSDDSTMDAEATACTDSPTSSHSGIHSNSQTNPCLQRFPSFLSSWCPYYLHTFRSQCPGPKYPTIPLLMWLDPNNWSMLEKTVHQSWKKYYSIFWGGHRGIEPRPSAVTAQSSNQWTTREFPDCILKQSVPVGYVQLLGMAQLLKPWHPAGHCHPHFLLLTAYLTHWKPCSVRDVTTSKGMYYKLILKLSATSN